MSMHATLRSVCASWRWIGPLAAGLAILHGLGVLAGSETDGAGKEFDRRNLAMVFFPLQYDNDPLADTVLLAPAGWNPGLVNPELLGLRRPRLAYLAKREGEVVAIAVPATAEDGFNGYVDLLLAVDMEGHIVAARVVRDTGTSTLHGVVDIIQSEWMRGFDGNSMRDIRRISWQKIAPEREYDAFVGASLTPKSVANRIYDALVFVQSNRIVLMRGGVQQLPEGGG